MQLRPAVHPLSIYLKVSLYMDALALAVGGQPSKLETAPRNLRLVSAPITLGNEPCRTRVDKFFFRVLRFYIFVCSRTLRVAPRTTRAA